MSDKVIRDQAQLFDIKGKQGQVFRFQFVYQLLPLTKIYKEVNNGEHH